MMKKIALLIYMFLVTIAPLIAQENLQQLFNQGVKAYELQQYSDAMNKFEAIVANGYSSGELYYNMGNTAFKQKNYPLAILYYEKARLLMPSDEDLETNLVLANAHTVDKIEPLPQLFFERWWASLLVLLSPTQWAVASLILLAVLLALFLLFRFGNTLLLRKTSFELFVVSGLFFILSLVLSHNAHSKLTAHDHAIVFVPSVTAKSSPTTDSVDIFVVHEGTKVEMSDQVGEWVRISLPNGSVGWLKANVLRII